MCKVLASIQSFPATAPDTDVETCYVNVNGTQIAVKIHRPKGMKGKLPIVFYIHGGGWVLGDDTTHDRLVRELAAGIPAAVVFPVYTPSPEAAFPQPTEELFFVLKHIVALGCGWGGTVSAEIWR